MRIYRLSQAEFRAWREHETRAELTKRIFTEHGVAQVRAPSGHILGTARQSNERVPIERAKTRAAHHAIRPGECMCREWQKPPGKEDEHHPICVNKASWESQQAHDPDAPRDRVVVSSTVAHAAPSEGTAPMQPPPPAGAALPAAAVAAAAALPAAAVAVQPAVAPTQAADRPQTTATPEPATCVCQVWAGVNSGRHHALCQFRSQWDREHAVPVPQLIELETGVVAREASTEEAAASKRKEPEDGVGAIELSDGKLYYVRTG
ncbi:MAG TPA: hypothetical protein VGJ91_07915 [Polyangiaceae bacterium]|jgi:hypothetical protein